MGPLRRRHWKVTLALLGRYLPGLVRPTGAVGGACFRLGLAKRRPGESESRNAEKRHRRVDVGAVLDSRNPQF